MAIIFDLDGTLLNTIEDMGNSMNRVLRAYDLPEHDIDAYRFFVGNGMPKLVERAIPENETRKDEILKDFLTDYAANYKVDSAPYPGVIEGLKKLNALNVPIAVCTNKKQEYTDGIMEQYFSDITFVAVIGDQFDGHHKPDPHHPLKIAEIFGVKPETIYFVGDSNVDMQTAQNAGMIPVGVSWGFRPVEELKTAGASQVIDDLSDILEIIKPSL